MATEEDTTPLIRTLVVITGVDDELKQNVAIIAGTPPLVSSQRKYRRYINSLPSQAQIAMGALGYYGASVQIKDQTTDGTTTVFINVTPNQPVLVNSISIEVTGEANDDPAYNQIMSKLPLQKGAIFVSDDYEDTKSALITQAQNLGYFDFVFAKSEVRVSRKKQSADIVLKADSGTRYTFGEILFVQELFRKEFLQRWVPFETGDPYQSGLIGELTQNLQNSGYFKSVRVVPQRDRRYGTTVPVKVDLTRKDNNEVAVGVGYVSDTGPRTKLTWGKPLLNRFGHSLDAEVGLSKEVQNASVAYRIPRRDEPLYNYWGIEYGLKNDSIGDTASFLSTLNFQRVSLTSSQWTESLFIRWEKEISTVSNVERTTDLILPGFSYSSTRSKGAPFPTRGHSASILMMGGSKRALSTIDFFKTVLKLRYLRAISNRNTLIAGLQYGAIQTNDFPGVPSSQRFFAGGDRSVRGYSFKDLSPRDVEDDAIGGRYLEVMSLEYSYRFLDLWSAAVFADTGRAFNNFSSAYSVGAGVGIRWQSPVGLFRIDLARPIDDDENDSLRVHLSLGPDL